MGTSGATEIASPDKTVPSQWQSAVPVGTNDCLPTTACPGSILFVHSLGADSCRPKRGRFDPSGAVGREASTPTSARERGRSLGRAEVPARVGYGG